MNKELPQNLLRHLKGHLNFTQVEVLRELLTRIRRGLTKRQFHILCDDLARDLENYGK